MRAGVTRNCVYVRMSNLMSPVCGPVCVRRSADSSSTVRAVNEAAEPVVGGRVGEVW